MGQRAVERHRRVRVRTLAGGDVECGFSIVTGT